MKSNLTQWYVGMNSVLRLPLIYLHFILRSSLSHPGARSLSISYPIFISWSLLYPFFSQVLKTSLITNCRSFLCSFISNTHSEKDGAAHWEETHSTALLFSNGTCSERLFFFFLNQTQPFAGHVECSLLVLSACFCVLVQLGSSEFWHDDWGWVHLFVL